MSKCLNVFFVSKTTLLFIINKLVFLYLLGRFPFTSKEVLCSFPVTGISNQLSGSNGSTKPDKLLYLDTIKNTIRYLDPATMKGNFIFHAFQ